MLNLLKVYTAIKYLHSIELAQQLILCEPGEVNAGQKRNYLNSSGGVESQNFQKYDPVNPEEKMDPKTLADKSDDELLSEYYYWDREITNAPRWGAAVATASEFRADAELELRRRNLIKDTDVDVPQTNELPREMVDSTTSGIPSREFPSGAKRDSESGKLRYTAALSPYALQALTDYMRRHNTQGHRSEENWKKGIPLDSFLDSQLRHTIHQWIKHDQKQHDQDLIDAICGVAFNCLGYLHELVKPGDRKMAKEYFAAEEKSEP